MAQIRKIHLFLLNIRLEIEIQLATNKSFTQYAHNNSRECYDVVGMPSLTIARAKFFARASRTNSILSSFLTSYKN